MKRIKVVLFIDIDPILWPLDEEEREWFDVDVLHPDNLSLHSNEIGDEVGEVVSASWEIITDEEETKLKILTGKP